MGGYTVVADASHAIAADSNLVSLINSESLISLESPAEHIDNKDSALLSIYLHRIGEDRFMKNRPLAEGPGGSQRRPPRTLMPASHAAAERADEYLS